MAVFRTWKIKGGGEAGRWVSARTGRIVKNVTVAKQQGVPRSAVKGNSRYAKRWTEVTAVSRIRMDDRYVEALRTRTLHDATKRELRKARRSVKVEAVRLLKAKLTDAERRKYGKEIKAGTRPEVRRRVTRPKAERKSEERVIGGKPEKWTAEKQAEYREWWADMNPEERRTMSKYLSVEVLGFVEGEEEDEGEDDVWEDANGRMHDTATGRFV